MKTYRITDLTFLGELVAALARDEIMPRLDRLALVDARQKASAFDGVTEADEQAEPVIGQHPAAPRR
jgi:fructose-1,6-bisphosphatase/inositol monophosphatase family enzyme